jgi:Isochorismatase family
LVETNRPSQDGLFMFHREWTRKLRISATRDAPAPRTDFPFDALVCLLCGIEVHAVATKPLAVMRSSRERPEPLSSTGASALPRRSLYQRCTTARDAATEALRKFNHMRPSMVRVWNIQTPLIAHSPVNALVHLVVRCLPKHLQKASGAGADRDTVALAGCEAHICLLQTALDLLEDEFDVWVVTDACSSARSPGFKLVG